MLLSRCSALDDVSALSKVSCPYVLHYYRVEKRRHKLYLTLAIILRVSGSLSRWRSHTAGSGCILKTGLTGCCKHQRIFFLCAPVVHLVSWGSAVLHPRLKFSGHWALTVRWCVVRTSKGTCHLCAWGTRPSDWTQWLQRAVEKVHLRTRRWPQI